MPPHGSLTSLALHQTQPRRHLSSGCWVRVVFSRSATASNTRGGAIASSCLLVAISLRVHDCRVMQPFVGSSSHNISRRENGIGLQSSPLQIITLGREIINHTPDANKGRGRAARFVASALEQLHISPSSLFHWFETLSADCGSDEILETVNIVSPAISIGLLLDSPNCTRPVGLCE